MSYSSRIQARPMMPRRRNGALRAFVVLMATSCLVSPSRAEGTLDWVVAAITGQSPAIAEVAISGDLSRGNVIEPSDQVSTGDGERIILTHGRDVLELQPNTTVAIGGAGPNGTATVVKLIDGTVHVKVGKRTPGHTFSVETRFLVATVKGTEFDVTADDDAAAVSVSEGTVAVRSSGGGQSVDVTPGHTAVASADDDDATPDVGATPAGGAPEAAKAAGKSPKGNASDNAGASAPGKGAGNSNGNGNANGAGNGNAGGNNNGAGNGNAGGNDNAGGNGNAGGSGNAGGNGNGNGNAGGNGNGGNGNGHSRGRIAPLNPER